MKKKKNILFTFDYELFLGKKSGTVRKCLLEPTEKIISLLNRHDAKGIFFIDTACLVRLQKTATAAARDDFSSICRQVSEMIFTGHYVFPHIHPHWLDAAYDPAANQWSLADLSKYRFHNIADSEKSFLFDESIKILHQVADGVKPGYVIDGYRAGGWTIQPFTDYRPFFEKHGIVYDFSVLPGFDEFTTAQYFDFRNAPAKEIYNFDHDVLVEDKSGKFTEFSISSVPLPGLTRLTNRVFLKAFSRSPDFLCMGDGVGVEPASLSGHSSFVHNRNFSREMAAVENMTSIKLPLYLEFLRKHDYMQLISHPKMFTVHNLSCFEKFIIHVSSQYDMQTNFRKMTA